MRRLGLVLITLGAMAAPAAAAGGGEAPTFLGLPQWVALTINLVVFFGILVYFAGPALVKFLEEKQREVRRALDTAEQQRKDADAAEARIQAQIDELREEVDEIAERSAREGERERTEILAEAEREAERISRQTRSEVEHRVEMARRELTAHAVALAAELAEKKLQDEVSAADRKRLFEDNVARMEEST